MLTYSKHFRNWYRHSVISCVCAIILPLVELWTLYEQSKHNSNKNNTSAAEKNPIIFRKHIRNRVAYIGRAIFQYVYHLTVISFCSNLTLFRINAHIFMVFKRTCFSSICFFFSSTSLSLTQSVCVALHFVNRCECCLVYSVCISSFFLLFSVILLVVSGACHIVVCRSYEQTINDPVRFHTSKQWICINDMVLNSFVCSAWINWTYTKNGV